MKNALCVVFLFWVVALPASAADKKPSHIARVKCVIVMPPDREYNPECRAMFEACMLDVQWWFSCQMESHGYGKKTFYLERDNENRVKIAVTRASKQPNEGSIGAVRSVAIPAAEKIVGSPKAREGDIVVVVWWGIVKDKKSKTVWCGSAVRKRDVLLTKKHFDAWKPNPRGTLIHEIAHAFGTHHNGYKENKCGNRHCTMHGATATFCKRVEKNFGSPADVGYGSLCKNCAAIVSRCGLIKTRPCISPPKDVPRSVGGLCTDEQYWRLMGTLLENTAQKDDEDITLTIVSTLFQAVHIFAHI